MAEITRPSIVDDSGTFTDGTILDEAFFDDIFDEVDDQCHSTTNPTVKPKATTDEVIAARGSKASLDARLDVALNEDGTPKAVAGQATETQLAAAAGNINLCRNSDLEDWAAGASSAPDHHTLSGTGAAIARTGAGESDTTDLGTGTYAAKITSGGAAAAKLTQAVFTSAEVSAQYGSIAGRSVGFAIRAKVANSNVLRLVIDDGVTTTASSYATGSVDEQDLSVVHELSASATKLDVYAEVALGTNVAYVGGFTAVFGLVAPSAWNPGFERFRAEILSDSTPTQVKIGGVPKTVAAAGVLFSSVTSSSKDTDGNEFYSVSIPAGTLGNNGDRLRVSFYVDAENTTAVNISPVVRFGATEPTTVDVGSGALSRFHVVAEIQRLTNTTQRLTMLINFYNASAGSGVPYQTLLATPGETLSGAVDLKIKLSASGGTRTTVAYGYVIEFIPAVA